MTMKPGDKVSIAGIEMYFYYWDGHIAVYEYYVEGKQFLYKETNK